MQSTIRSVGQAEALADAAQDPRVGLVVDEQVDVLKAHLGERERLERRLGHPGDGMPEGVLPLHADPQLIAVDDDQLRARAVRAEAHGPDPPEAGASC